MAVLTRSDLYRPSKNQYAFIVAMRMLFVALAIPIPYAAAKALAEYFFSQGGAERAIREMRRVGLLEIEGGTVRITTEREFAANELGGDKDPNALPNGWCNNLVSHINTGVRNLTVNHLRHSARVNNPTIKGQRRIEDATARAQPHVPPPRVHRNVPQPKHPTVGFQAPPPPPRGGDRPARRPTRPQSSLPE